MSSSASAEQETDEKVPPYQHLLVEFVSGQINSTRFCEDFAALAVGHTVGDERLRELLAAVDTYRPGASANDPWQTSDDTLRRAAWRVLHRRQRRIYGVLALWFAGLSVCAFLAGWLGTRNIMLGLICAAASPSFSIVLTFVVRVLIRRRALTRP